MDRQLQSAILASLNSAYGPPSSFGSRGGGGGSRNHVTVTRSFRSGGGGSGHHGSRGPTRSQSYHSGGGGGGSYGRSSGGGGYSSSRSAGRSSQGQPHGRFSTLAKEGIVPSQGSFSRGSSSGSGAVGGKRAPQRRSRGGRSIGSRTLATDEGEMFKTLGNGWIQRTAGGSFKRCGLHTQVEGLRASDWFLVTYEPTTHSSTPAMHALAKGQCNVEVVVKAVRPTDPGDKPKDAKSQFHIVVGYKSPKNWYALSADTKAGLWSFVSADGTELAAVTDTTMKADIFLTIVMMVRGDSITVEANGTPVFPRVRLPSGALKGAVGFGCCDSKLVFKSLRVMPTAASNSGGSSSGGGGGGGGSGGASSGRHRTSNSSNSSGGGSSRNRNSYGSVAASAAAAPRTSDAGGGGAGGGAGARHTPRTSSATSASGSGDRSSKKPSRSIKTMGPKKDLPRFEGGDAGLVRQVEADILDVDLGVSFDDIAALDTAKRLLNEAVVLPLLVPEMFTGIREPWKGVLLFGPPGTGKTMLAKGVASMNGVTFFNCNAASIVSKWRGESEKLVRTMFDMARFYSPSIIFIDEVDALVQRRGTGSEHEASRRLKTMFLTQMDGIASAADGGGLVMVLATSNTPWDLDEALRRRLEKRIYIPLPDEAARQQMIELNLKDVPTEDDVSAESLASVTEGYSGADIHLVCREASMMGMRRLLINKTPTDIAAMRAAGELQSPPVSTEDLEAAIAKTRPSVSSADCDKYSKWDSQFGSS